MRILLLGSEGQLGSELKKQLPAVGQVKACSRQDIDLTDFESIRDVIGQMKPHCIVNAAAYTGVDAAESESDLAYRINADAVAVLAHEASMNGAFLIHYSTDYVFGDDESKEPHGEREIPMPLNLYGRSKLQGELAIAASGCRHLIFRTSWVVGEKGHNFVKTILNLAHKRSSLQVVNDQWGVPTPTPLIAKVTAEAIAAIDAEPWPSGLYHLSPKGETTWYDVACYALSIAKERGLVLSMDSSSIAPIPSTDYPTAARRPYNSRLATEKLQQQLKFELPKWDRALEPVVQRIIEELRVA